MKNVRMSMGMITLLIVVGLFLASAERSAARRASVTYSAYSEATRVISVEERALREFANRTEKLERSARESSNASRRALIENLQNAMAGSILRMEERVGEEHAIIQHGKDARTRDSNGRTTHSMESKKLKKDLTTGGTTVKQALNRLARMQSTYRVCSNIREKAIAKEGDMLPAYIQRLHEFANYMNEDIASIRSKMPENEPVAVNSW